MKKVLMVSVALLVLSVIMFPPVKARTAQPYEAVIKIQMVEPGEQWITEDGILQIKNSYWLGTEEGTLGTNKFEDWESFNIDLNTGEGAFHGKWLLSVNEQDTIGGSAAGTITEGYKISGMFVGTHGTGALENAKKMGLLEGFLLDPTHAVLDCWGTVVYP